MSDLRRDGGDDHGDQIHELDPLAMIILEGNKYYHVQGGADRAFFLTGQLLRERGHEVIPFSTVHERNEPSPYAGYFVDVPEWEDLKRAAVGTKVRVFRDVLFNRQAYRNVRRLIRAYHPDVVHVHNIHHQLSPSILYAAREAGLPVVMTLHDYRLICANGYLYHDGICERCLSHRFYSPLLTRCIRSSVQAGLLGGLTTACHWMVGVWRDTVDLFLSPSQFLRGKMIEAGIPASSIAVLPNPVIAAEDPALPQPEGPVLYFGALTPQKGLPILLRAAEVAGEIPLLLCGEGNDRAAYEEWCRRRNLRNVRFAGFGDSSAVRRALRESRYVVVPSAWYENCPFAILESFAEGRCVVASAIGGIPELVTDGVEGVLVPASDAEALASALRMLAARPDLVARMGESAWRRVREQHDPGVYVRALEQVFERLTNRQEKAATAPVGIST